MHNEIVKHIDLMRDSQNQFPFINDPLEIISARIWHCKYRSLFPLGKLLNLEELVIGTLPDESLDFLGGLKKLKFLSILHMPKIKNLDILAELEKVEILSLATSPSWDSSNKITVVDSLEPISRMPSLKHLQLFGIVPKEKSVSDLLVTPGLLSARLSKYPDEELQKMRSRGISEEYAPNSSFD